MFDFHTHILPGIDDGSKSVAESLAMLRALKEQGVSGVAATPHFYPQQSSPERFFAARQAAWERLRPALPSDAPQIRLGAEVQYFEGIQRVANLKDFCLEGTGLLLVEMPFCTWTARMLSSVEELQSRRDVSVMLAHIERYLHLQSKQTVGQLLQSGICLQVSTDYFRQSRRRALRLLREGVIQFLGTDCHNMGGRKPDYAAAVQTISREIGERWLRELEQREARILHET